MKPYTVYFSREISYDDVPYDCKAEYFGDEFQDLYVFLGDHDLSQQLDKRVMDYLKSQIEAMYRHNQEFGDENAEYDEGA